MFGGLGSLALGFLCCHYPPNSTQSCPEPPFTSTDRRDSFVTSVLFGLSVH